MTTILSRLVPTFVLLAGCATLSGCGAGPESTASVDAGAKAALEDLGQGLQLLSEQKEKPPARLEAFASLEPLIPVAASSIRDGSVVYLWGAAFSPSGEKVVAYEKKTPTEGGLVLLENGTVREMTAEEFKAAPKAEAKK
jgi:hypothetical protein